MLLARNTRDACGYFDPGTTRLECPRFHRCTRGLQTITAVTTTVCAPRSEVLWEIVTHLQNVQHLVTLDVQWTRGMSRVLLGHTNRGSATANSRYPAEKTLGDTLERAVRM